MENKYFITRDQLETIQHHKRMFELNAEYIKGLCSSEKDDIVYGFTLGEMHSHLRLCFIEMMELESEIIKQVIVVDDKEYPNLTAKLAEKMRILNEIHSIVDKTNLDTDSNEFKIWQLINNPK